jgi:hypothetical protein
VPLTDEHIVPQALGERYFIPNACCDNCQTIIHGFETRSLNSIILRPLKKMLGLSAKRRKSHPNQTFRLYVYDHSDRPVPIDIPVADLMLSALVPEFPLPGMLQKTARASSYVHDNINIHVFGKQDIVEQLNALGYRRIGGILPIEDFARMLAKIGHCLAVATYGPDKFHSFVLPYILHGGNGWQYYIGNPPNLNILIDRYPMYYSLKGELNLGLGTNIIFAEIKFSSHIDDMPRYRVIVGRFLGSPEEFLSYALLPGQYERKRPVPMR